MSPEYTLTVKNQSECFGNICLYHRNDGHSIVWFSKSLHPDTVATFRWTMDYSFVWGELDVLIPGVIFRSSQIVEADPDRLDKNSIGFSRQDGAYLFTKPQRQGNPGSLVIQTDETIPMHGATIGVGISGKAAFVALASPNFTYSFIPRPNYWVAFGGFRDFNDQEILDCSQITQTAKVLFPPNVYAMTATFGVDHEWSIK